MDSSENNLAHSVDFYHLHKQLEKDPEENSNCKDGFNAQRDSKFPSTADNRSAIYALLRRIEALEKKLDGLEGRAIEQPRKKKKIRRRAREIPRIYKCTLANCGKEYGSEASLKNHRKIKHGIRLFRSKKPQQPKPANP